MPKIQKGLTLNRTELAAAHGVSLPTIDTWVNNGCPCDREGGKGSTYAFNSAAVIDWRLAQARADKRKGGTAATLDEAKLRREVANAELTEIDLAEKRGEVVPVEHVAKQVGKLLANVRARMLAIPTKVAPLTQTAGSIEEARAAIEDHIRDGLSELVSASAVMALDVSEAAE